MQEQLERIEAKVDQLCTLVIALCSHLGVAEVIEYDGEDEGYDLSQVLTKPLQKQ